MLQDAITQYNSNDAEDFMDFEPTIKRTALDSFFNPGFSSSSFFFTNSKHVSCIWYGVCAVVDSIIASKSLSTMADAATSSEISFPKSVNQIGLFVPYGRGWNLALNSKQGDKIINTLRNFAFYRIKATAYSLNGSISFPFPFTYFQYTGTNGNNNSQCPKKPHRIRPVSHIAL